MTAASAIPHHRQVVEQERRLINSLPDLQREFIDSSASALDTAQSRNTITGTPTPALYLVKAAFDELGWDSRPRTIMAARHIPTLLRIARIECAPLEPEAVTYNKSSSQGCSGAENRFVEAAAQLLNKTTGEITQNLRVYCDADGQPLAFGKSEKDRTSLLLRPVTALASGYDPRPFLSRHAETDREGVIMPAGTIVTISSDGYRPVGNKRYGAWDATVFTRSAEESCFPLPRIRPIRLSAWAYENSDDRQLFAVSNNGEVCDAGRAAMLASTDLEMFRQAAAMILDECGVIWEGS